MTMQMGLVGYGIAKSRMARLQNYLGQLHGVDINYGLIDGAERVEFDCLSEIRQRIAQGYCGFNVTHPYKEKVLTIVDAPLIAEHATIGSYNTLKVTNGKILAANTDFSGFMRGFKARLPNRQPGKVLMCGAGGVGRAVAFALAQLGAEQISIYDLAEDKAASLCQALQQQGVHAEPVTQADFASSMQQANGLVNCTALGMHSYPGSAFPADGISKQHWAFDAVYTPLKTEFLARCEQQGLSCISGFDLWIYQGLDAFSIFTGVTVVAHDEILATALSWLD